MTFSAAVLRCSAATGNLVPIAIASNVTTRLAAAIDVSAETSMRVNRKPTPAFIPKGSAACVAWSPKPTVSLQWPTTCAVLATRSGARWPSTCSGLRRVSSPRASRSRNKPWTLCRVVCASAPLPMNFVQPSLSAAICVRRFRRWTSPFATRINGAEIMRMRQGCWLSRWDWGAARSPRSQRRNQSLELKHRTKPRRPHQRRAWAGGSRETFSGMEI